jgi:hypothetical protein
MQELVNCACACPRKRLAGSLTAAHGENEMEFATAVQSLMLVVTLAIAIASGYSANRMGAKGNRPEAPKEKPRR